MFQEDLQRRVDRIGIAIRGAHCPPETSKDNPIEHRLFPHLTRACPGVIFAGVALVKELMERAKTSTGWLAGDGGHPRQGLADRTEGCGGVQGEQEDRVRRDPPEGELPSDPERHMKSASH